MLGASASGEGEGEVAVRVDEELSASAAASSAVVTIVIAQPSVAEEAGCVKKEFAVETDESAAAAVKVCYSRSGSEREQCRVCQQQTDEPLIELGCRCRGELAKAHRPCIEMWFRTRGSNKCEICQQVTANVPPPDSQPSTSYWIWRVDGAFGANRERERGCYSPLWIAFAILIGGLLLDVLISVSLGVSALPVNIIIGVLIILGLGTAFRLSLECCYEWGTRRNTQRPDITVNPGYRPVV